MTNLLDVRIDSPQKTLWEGKALSVSSKNGRGVFDILPQHASFITLVENEPLRIVEENKKAQTFTFTRCVIYTHKDKVVIYTNI